MANLTLPNPTIPIATCPHCKQEMKINEVWYRIFTELYKLINANLP